MLQKRGGRNRIALSSADGTCGVFEKAPYFQHTVQSPFAGMSLFLGKGTGLYPIPNLPVILLQTVEAAERFSESRDESL